MFLYMEKKKVLITGGSGFIGVHCVDFLKEKGYEILNLDINQPKNNRNMNLWSSVSILNFKDFEEAVICFNPNYIVHLAANTNQNAKDISEFLVNIEGTINIAKIAKSLPNLKKIIFTSTQYVNSPLHQFSDDVSKLKPYGLYGESKLINEKFIHENCSDISWTIIRPAVIWGPWHPVLVDGLWKQIFKGRYLHPMKDEVIKAYGFVGNTVWQIEKILSLENYITDKQTIYLADENYFQRNWVNGFVNRLSRRKICMVPKSLIYILSEFGEFLRKLGISFQIYRSRYNNLTTSNPIPLEKTRQIFGNYPTNLQASLDFTCIWLEKYFKSPSELFDQVPDK